MRTLLSGWITRLDKWMRKLPSDLSPARIEAIEARMRPGISSREGFLDAHERLLDVIRRDEGACQKRGISPHQVADRIESIVGKAHRLADVARRGRTSLPEGAVRGLIDGEGAGIIVDDQFRVTGQHWRGVQECPFENERGKPCQGNTHAFADLRIENLRYREEFTPHRSDASPPEVAIEFPGLIMHLIRDHHFFEGSVPYRLDPERAVDVLEIEAGIDYAPKYATEATWRIREGTGARYDSLKPWHRAHFGRCMERPDRVIDVADGIRLYVKGDTCSVIADREHQLERPLVISGAEVDHAGHSIRDVGLQALRERLCRTLTPVLTAEPLHPRKAPPNIVLLLLVGVAVRPRPQRKTAFARQCNKGPTRRSYLKGPMSKSTECCC